MKHLSVSLKFFVILLLAGCTSHKEPLIVKFEGKIFEKKWALKELNPELPADWSKFGFLTFELKSSTTQLFNLKLYDAGGIRRLQILPFQGVWIRASIPLTHFQAMNTEGTTMSSVWKTSRPGYWIGFTGSVGSITNIDSLGVEMRRPIGSPTLEIRNMQLTMNEQDTVFGPVPLVDDLGQWIPDEWQGKAKTLDELKSSWTAEDSDLKPGDFNVSKFGGFFGTKVKATGFFRVEKIDGKWWFVDPEGYLFYSNGSTGISPQSELSRVQGREYIFTTLPPADELTIPNQYSRNAGTGITNENRPARNAASGQAASARPARRASSSSFFTWNIYRRFGSDWYQKWMDFTVRRMDSWGLNTIANWSDATLGGSHRKAYVANISGWGNGSRTMGMPDVYAPDYAATVYASAARQCAQRKDDPYLLGYFIGNEPPWPDRELELIKLILDGDDTPMKAELNKLLAAGDTPERRIAFVYDTYAKFVSIVNKAIKKYDPNHLNLGIRFGGSAPDEIIKASKNSFDVFSINIYGYVATPSTLQKIYDLTGLPIIIGEFHFGTPGRGLAPGLAQVKNQEERGVAYRYYVENAAAHPALIGTHWFQWVDQPSTGRGDGENYNIGFVDVTDRPYPEMVNAARETFKRIRDIHSGKIPPVSREALTQ